jgi:plastocyanin
MNMQRFLMTVAFIATTFAVYGCGSSTSPSPTSPSPNPTPTSPTPTGPTSTPDPTAGAITINVVRENGAQSFSPNPATVPPGQMVVWHNVDTVTHRVVLNDGTLDTGNIAPGAFSAPMILRAVGPYHCSIHPSMVGTIVSGQ